MSRSALAELDPLALILHNDQNQPRRLPLPSRDYPTGDLDLALEYRVVAAARHLVWPNAKLGRGRFGKLLTIGISFFQDETPSLRASSVSFRAAHNVRM
jgi:hypothetical protein